MKLKINKGGILSIQNNDNFNTNDDFNSLVEGIMSTLSTAGKTVIHPLDILHGMAKDSPEAEVATSTEIDETFVKGGSITFSTKVTSNPYNKYKETPQDKTSLRVGVNLKNIYLSILNSINKNRNINDIILKVAERAKKNGIKLSIDFTLSNKNVGNWVDLVSKKGTTEPSYTLTFDGFPIQIIEEIGLEIMNTFKQQAVLIKDFENNKRYILKAKRTREEV